MPIPVFCPKLKMPTAVSDGADDADDADDVSGAIAIGDGSELDEVYAILDCRVVVMLASEVRVDMKMDWTSVAEGGRSGATFTIVPVADIAGLNLSDPCDTWEPSYWAHSS
jgi:hypothetical protein